MSLKPKRKQRVTHQTKSVNINQQFESSLKSYLKDYTVQSVQPTAPEGYKNIQLISYNSSINIVYRETKHLLTIADFTVYPRGKGIGSKFMLALKQYSDQTKKHIFLKHAITKWYDQFKWLTPKRTLDGNEHYVYNPQRS